MTNSVKFSIAKIRNACRQEPRSLRRLSFAGVVGGEFGITALRAREIVRQLVAAGELSVSFDDCHCQVFTVNRSVPAGTLLTQTEREEST
jgi:hypothetical protein